eukprot:891410-Amphidinium_carterae.1
MLSNLGQAFRLVSHGLWSTKVGLVMILVGVVGQAARPMQETDAWTNMRTFSRVPMKFDVSVFRKAGGALAEGHEVDVPSGHEWAS